MTILFQSDWTNENGRLRAIPHTTTKNTTFLRTCALFKKMGIKNYAFPLALYDPDLKDVDVHDLEDNTPENEIIRTKVQIEARRNVWYFLRECVRVDAAGGSPVKFRLDRAAAAMTWCFLNGIDYAATQPRQTGKSICAATLCGWMIYISGSKFQIGSMTKDSSLREENVKRVKSVGENLPNWWMAENKFKDKKNTEEIYYSQLDNHFITYVANADPRKADLQARGASPPAFWFDEFEFIINIAISYPTILASTGTARENARLNGKPHSNIITTTAGDPKKKECREAAAILDGAMAFTELLYDLENRDKLHEVVSTASPQKMVLGVFSHLQLGYDNAWLKEKITRNRMTKDQAMRDYLNRRVSIQEKPIIPEQTLATINSSQMDPKYMQIINGKYVIFWYISEEEVKSAAFRDRPIVVGCDSSEMIERDATTMIGIDPKDLSVVFSWRCNEGNINTVGMMMAQLMLMYPKMILVPENKSSGTSLIDIISLLLRREGNNPFTRIFNWVVDRRTEQEFAKYDIRNVNLLDTSVKRYFGIKTDKSKREELYSTTLLTAVSKAASKIRDKTLIAELGSLTVRNGRVDHEVGGTDDMVIAFLMAIWFILNAKHLDVYGIKPGTVLSIVTPGNQDKTRLSLEHQQKVRQKIEELNDQLKIQKDPVFRKLIESDLVVLKSMVQNVPISSPQTADELNRDPSKFINPELVAESRNSASVDDMERSLRAIMSLG